MNTPWNQGEDLEAKLVRDLVESIITKFHGVEMPLAIATLVFIVAHGLQTYGGPKSRQKALKEFNRNVNKVWKDWESDDETDTGPTNRSPHARGASRRGPDHGDGRGRARRAAKRSVQKGTRPG